MGKYIVKYDRNGCIGAGVCAAVDPDHWEMSTEDGKADLKNATKKGDQFELEIDQPSEKLVEAAKGCPVIVIKIINKETGEEVS